MKKIKRLGSVVGGIVGMAVVVASSVSCFGKGNNHHQQGETRHRQSDFARADDSKRMAYRLPEQDSLTDEVQPGVRLSMYKKADRELYIERDTSWATHCYAVEKGEKRRIELGDKSFFSLTYFAYDRYLYLVGDTNPNSNGWTCRYSLYRIDLRDFSLKHICDGAAIRFRPREIVMADARLTNPDADCTADEIWVMHDVHFDVKGNKIREDKREYDYAEMERRYGETLINTKGIAD